jgi:hypothetical protein
MVSKVQENRRKQILLDIISPEQSTLIPVRFITDNIISAYECLHFMKKKKNKKNFHCALKLDMMKAYSHVESIYLERIMLKLGLNPHFVQSVMRGVRSVSFSVLFNGQRMQEFTPSRGIRQGDPISPYLILLAAEGLSCLLKSREVLEQDQGVKVAPTAPMVNHLLFADDLLLFFQS